jgi:hypothetical protein
MKLTGGAWSKGDFFAALACVAAVLAIPGMPKLFHWDSDSHGQAVSLDLKPPPSTASKTPPAATEAQPTPPATPLVKHQQTKKTPGTNPAAPLPGSKTFEIGAGADVKAEKCSAIGIDNTVLCSNYDPNKEEVTYDENGTKRTSVKATGKLIVHFPSPPIDDTFRKFTDRKDWSGLLAWAEQEKQDEIGWLTPYYISGFAHMNLCKGTVATQEMEAFLAKTAEYPAYANSRKEAQGDIEYMKGAEYARKCTVPQ